MSIICKGLPPSAKETETCSGLCTVCQPLEEAVPTADHTSECPVYFRATLRAELKEGAMWEPQELERSWVGKAGGSNEDTQMTLTLMVIFLVIFLGKS